MILLTITLKIINFFSVKYNFNLVFDDNFYPCIESDLCTNSTICYWKKILKHAVEDFYNQRYIIPHRSKMNIITLI